MTAKFTPGPWTWGDGWKDWDKHPWDVNQEYSGPKYADIALNARGRQIIPLRIDHYDIEWDSANGIGDFKPADRALIAAAPELLEALKALYACFDDEGELREEFQDQLSTAFERADWAILKAEGRT